MPPFHMRMGSPWNEMSEPQEQMLSAIKRTHPKNGIVSGPCALGKSAVMIKYAIETYHLCAFFCPTAQGCYQLAESMKEHTTLIPKSQICLYCGKEKHLPRGGLGFLITTYAMFADSKSLRNQASKEARDKVLGMPWQCLFFDEAQHIPADTYMKLINTLLLNSGARGLAFTATPFRNEYNLNKSREEHEREAFGWFAGDNPVIFRISCRELENAGLIAKIRRARISVTLTPVFRKAYEMTSGADKKYIASLNPCKLSMVKAICATHKAMGQAGIVFVTHLLTARVVGKILGSQWEIMSGGSAHGEDEAHTPERNNDIVHRFNAGEMDGLICTQVGYSSMDVHRESCCFLVVVEADGGIASAAQRLGRVARNKRISAMDAESDEDLRKRRLKHQKVAKYYDLVTLDTEDVAAAHRRERLFDVEGYGKEVSIDPSALLRAAVELGEPPLYDTLAEEVLLLKEVLQYRTLANVCAKANAAASKAKAPYQNRVKEVKAKKENSKTSVMKHLYKRQEEKAKKEKEAAAVKVMEERRDAIDNAPLCAESIEIFKALIEASLVGFDVLDATGLIETLYPASDGED